MFSLSLSLPSSTWECSHRSIVQKQTSQRKRERGRGRESEWERKKRKQYFDILSSIFPLSKDDIIEGSFKRPTFYGAWNPLLRADNDDGSKMVTLSLFLVTLWIQKDPLPATLQLTRVRLTHAVAGWVRVSADAAILLLNVAPHTRAHPIDDPLPLWMGMGVQRNGFKFNCAILKRYLSILLSIKRKLFEKKKKKKEPKLFCKF